MPAHSSLLDPGRDVLLLAACNRRGTLSARVRLKHHLTEFTRLTGWIYLGPSCMYVALRGLIFIRWRKLSFEARIGALLHCGWIVRQEAAFQRKASVQIMTLEQVVSRDPDIVSGALVFKGTRVPVQTLIDYLKSGETLDRFLDGFPTVSREQAEAYLELTLGEAEDHA